MSRKSFLSALGRWRRPFLASFIACFCFVALAVYGWGLTWSEVLQFAFILLVLLLSIVLAAAFLGWLLYRLRRWRSR
ncbi:MAG TPA: hypothetical protein VIC08_09640 [Cellvibrionaceae bacterium]